MTKFQQHPSVHPSEGWTALAFEAATSDGIAQVAGWVKGQFGLDFRVFDDGQDWDSGYVSGWQVTHLGTGFKVCGIIAPLRQATELADVLAGMADWAEAEASDVSAFIAPFAEFKGAHPGVVVRYPIAFGPLLTEKIAADLAQQSREGAKVGA